MYVFLERKERGGKSERERERDRDRERETELPGMGYRTCCVKETECVRFPTDHHSYCIVVEHLLPIKRYTKYR